MRYIVHDVDAAIALYVGQLGFNVEGLSGRQIIANDPSGNPIESFELSRTVARLDAPR